MRQGSLTTILAATDLSALSRAVVARAAALARQHQARLILTYVHRPSKGLPKRIGLGKSAVRSKDAAHAQLHDIAAQLDGVEVSCHVETGKPADRIAELVATHGVDLVVVGLHKERRVLDLLRLTTMEQITLKVPCPVLIAQRPDASPYRCVLGAICFTPASAVALNAAAQLAPEATFHAIHALQLPLSAKLPAVDLETTRHMTEAEMLRDSFMRTDGLPPQLHLPEIVPGGVHDVIAFRISELHPDLVAIGSDSGRADTRLGNYARDLMRAPPTDMLVAKPV